MKIKRFDESNKLIKLTREWLEDMITPLVDLKYHCSIEYSYSIKENPNIGEYIGIHDKEISSSIKSIAYDIIIESPLYSHHKNKFHSDTNLLDDLIQILDEVNKLCKKINKNFDSTAHYQDQNGFITIIIPINPTKIDAVYMSYAIIEQNSHFYFGSDVSYINKNNDGYLSIKKNENKYINYIDFKKHIDKNIQIQYDSLTEDDNNFIIKNPILTNRIKFKYE